MKTIFLILCIFGAFLVPVSSSLFVSNAVGVKKLQSFRKLYDKSVELKGQQPSATFEDKFSVLIQNSPVLSVQSALSVLLLGNVVAEALSVIPKEAQSDVRAQAVVVAFIAKLIATVQSLEVAVFPTRDQYFSKDLLIEARDEIGRLVTSPLGMSAGYLAVVLATQCRKGCTVPFLIGEVPSLLRYLAIVCVISWPKKSSIKLPGVEWLFRNAVENTDEASVPDTSVIDVDKICDYAASLTEIVVVSKIALGLFRTSKGASIRGFADMLLLSARILLIQNFLYLRVGQVLRSSYSSAWVETLKKQSVVQQALSLADPSSWPVSVRSSVDLVRQIADPAARGAAARKLRELLGRHNIAVLPGGVDIPVTKARTTVVREGTDGESAPTAWSPAATTEDEEDPSPSGASASASASGPGSGPGSAPSALPKRGVKKKGAAKGKAASQRRKNYKTVV